MLWARVIRGTSSSEKSAAPRSGRLSAGLRRRDGSHDSDHDRARPAAGRDRPARHRRQAAAVPYRQHAVGREDVVAGRRSTAAGLAVLVVGKAGRGSGAALDDDVEPPPCGSRGDRGRHRGHAAFSGKQFLGDGNLHRERPCSGGGTRGPGSNQRAESVVAGSRGWGLGPAGRGCAGAANGKTGVFFRRWPSSEAACWPIKAIR